MRRAVLACAVLMVVFTLVAVPAGATGPYSTPAAMMDGEWLQGHHSEITGEMVQNVWRYYGIPPHVYLTIIGAETGMGDTVYGGKLVGVFNYGCIRAFNNYATTKWGALANGTTWVAGKEWLTFPSVTIGVNAVGRLLKVGPRSNPGFYLECFKRGDWAAFAAVYYGANVPGLSEYIANLEKIDAKLCTVAASYGWLW